MTKTILLATAFSLTLVFSLFAGDGTAFFMDEVNLSSRDGSATRTVENDSCRFVHTGSTDWSMSSVKHAPVQAGEIYRLEGRVNRAGGSGSFNLGVVLRDAENRVVQLTYAPKALSASSPEIQTEFIIPKGVAAIQPRLTGYGEGIFTFSGFILKRKGKIDIPEKLPKTLPLENDTLRVEFSPDDETFTVHDKRTGRSWTPGKTFSDWLTLNRKTTDGGVKTTLYSLQRMVEIEATVKLEPDRPELTIRLDGNGELTGPVFYPAPFSTKPGDRLILPMNEGLGIPVDDSDTYFDRYSANFYAGHGLCMSLFGIAEDESGAGLLGIVESADDSGLQTRRDGEKLLAPQVRWDPQKKRFGYSRNLRLVLLDRGGYVAMTKRYRQYASETGRLVTFRQKIQRNPRLKDGIDKLLGAANIWCWGTLRLETVRMLQESLVDKDLDRFAIIRELREAGIDRILWSAGGPPEDLAAMNALPNVLTSRYDIYQDTMDPAERPHLNVWNHCWTPEAWPHDLVWSDPDGTWARGWAVRKKGETKPTVRCGQLCDTKSSDYARKRIGEDLKTRPYTARFIDVTTAAAWRECWNPDHPMNRSECRACRMRLLELVGKEFNLVCGGETGHDAAVPYCDYFEGLLSFAPFRVPDSGRNLPDIWDEVPERVAKYQVGEQYRLPLWELVYHDCCVAMWYWGDYNNKLPAIWKKRDLFNALYGTPPMYLFNRDSWNENKERFAESAKVTMPVARLAAYEEMTDHRCLTPDRTVQQSIFANGVRVTVNFGSESFAMPDGFSLGPLQSRIEKP